MWKPIGDLLKFLAESLAPYLWERLSRFPLVIAQSATLARLVTLAGFSIISAGLVSALIHAATVQDAVRSTEEYARDASRDVELLLSRAGALADISEGFIRRTPGSLAALQTGDIVLPIEALLRLSGASGLAVIIGGTVHNLRGGLDQTATTPAWNESRWSEISLKLERALEGEREEATLFLGLERMYRTKSELDSGQRLDGSLAIARVWKEDKLRWVGVVVLLPLSSLTPLLHLESEAYLSGNYDYLVDCEGYLLLHPRPFTISGTMPSGQQVRAASNESEIGQLPINTRDADWIAGGDMLSRAFNSMVRNQPTSVVYKNLQRANRLTSFRLVNLKRQNIDGCLGLVAGRGLGPLEAIVAPVLLRSPAALGILLKSLVVAYLTIVGGWIAFVTRIRSLQGDLVAWSPYVTGGEAQRLGLVPIRDEPTEPVVMPDMVGIVVSLEFTSLAGARLQESLDRLGNLVVELRADGWIVSRWTLHTLFAARLLRPTSNGNSRLHQEWSPSVVAGYIKSLGQYRGLMAALKDDGLLACRVAYSIGELRVHAFRAGSTKDPVISFFGNCLTEAVLLDGALSQSVVPPPSGLFYSVDMAVASGLSVLGEEVVLNGARYRKVMLDS